MEWNERKILETLRMIESSGYDEVRIETPDFKLHVRRSGIPDYATATRAPAPESAPVEPRRQGAEAAQASPAAPAPQRIAPGHPVPPAGIVVVRAPMIGTFYRASAPHAPPFTEEGAAVTSEDTVCLIEVMKLFNTIKAGTAGRIVRVLAQNAATVQKDEPLFWIEP